MPRRTSPTTKISIAITAEDLQTLRAHAKRLHGGNLSAAVADAAAQLRREAAFHRYLELVGAPPLTAEDAAEVDEEIRAARAPLASKKGRGPARRAGS